MKTTYFRYLYYHSDPFLSVLQLEKELLRAIDDQRSLLEETQQKCVEAENKLYHFEEQINHAQEQVSRLQIFVLFTDKIIIMCSDIVLSNP